MSKLVDTTAGLVKLFQKNIDKAFMSLDTSLNKTSHMVQRQSPVGFQQLTDRLNECCGHIMKGQTPPETGVKKVPLQEAFRKIIMNWVESTLRPCPQVWCSCYSKVSSRSLCVFPVVYNGAMFALFHNMKLSQCDYMKLQFYRILTTVSLPIAYILVLSSPPRYRSKWSAS